MNTMAQSAKNKKRVRIQHKCVEIPEDLAKFLNATQLKVLQGYLANYTYQELAEQIGIGHRKKAQMLDALMDLGRALAIYRIIECELVPDHSGSSEYMRGWMDCKKFIWRLIKNEKSRWTTIKTGNCRKKRKS